MATSTSQAPGVASSSTANLTPAGHPLDDVGRGESSSTAGPATANVYYNPNRHWRSSSHFFTNPMPLSAPPCIPPVQSDTAGKSTTDSMLEHVWASLKTLQSQFTAFQESLGTVNSDVKDALSQLRTLRTAQNKTEKSIVDLEGIIGVTSRKGRNAAGTVPENTLVQSVALIQSAIQVLLARENQASQSDLSVDHRQTRMLSLPPSDFSGQESLHRSSHIVDPHRQFSALQSTQFISPTSQSDVSSPLSPLFTPTLELNKSSFHALPEKEYADASTQTFPFSPTFEHAYSHKDIPILTPVNWSAVSAALRHPVSTFAQQTTFTVEQSGALSSDTSNHPFHGPMVPDTQVPMPAPFTSHYSGTGLAAASPSRTPISIRNASTQASSLTTEAAELSHGITPFDTSRMSSPLSSLASTCNAPISVSCAPTSEDQHHTDLSLGVARIVHSGANLASGSVVIHTSEPISVASGFRRHSTPIGTDAGEEMPSGLPTPPSETSTDDHEPQGGNRVTCELSAAIDPKSNPHTFEAFSQSLSPLTPTPLSPYAGSEGSFPEKNVGDATERSSARKVMEGRINCNATSTAEDGSGGEGASEDAVTSDSATNLGVPVISVTDEHPRTTSEFDDDSSPAPQAVGDGDLSVTPKSSARKSNLELAEYHPDAGTTSVYSQMDGYDITFSSPWRRPSPPTSATPSRYTTPSESRPTQEEDEVWDALVLGASGISTPVPDSPHLPLMFSHQTSRASSDHPHSLQQPTASTVTLVQESLAVDPSMLHDPPPSLRGSGTLNSPWNSSLSSLTSLVDMDDEVVEHSRSEISRSSHSHAPTPPIASASRAVSEATRNSQRAGTRSLGGPSASLDQLVLLARREPLKIHFKLPERMRSLKRKRDVDGEGNEAGETSEAGGEHVRHGTAGKAKQEGQVKAAQNSMRADVSPCRTRPASSGTRPVPRNSIRDAGECSDDASFTPAPRKRTRKRNGRETQAPVRQKESKRASNTKQSSPSKYHVWNGQIVAVEMVSEPLPPAAAEPPQTLAISVPQPSVPVEEASEELESLARLRHRSSRENQAMKAPLSSPTSRSSPRSLRVPRSSPMKDGLWKSIHQCGGTWPELPVAFSQWDVQFIQCDNCDKWYHYGCAGIQSKDPRLELGSLFICPTCHTQSARRQTLRYQDDKCARSDCPEPCITTDTETFYLEKLVGRKKMDGYLYMWLAKWEGYPMNQATWIPKENVFGDGTRIFNNFLEEALEEGADLSQDLILLREAVDAGWEER